MRRVRVVAPLRDPARPVPVVFFAVVVRFVVPLLDEARVDDAPFDDVARPEAPWREDPARPLGRGLRLVAVTVHERYPVPPSDPGSLGLLRAP